MLDSEVTSVHAGNARYGASTGCMESLYSTYCTIASSLYEILGHQDSSCAGDSENLKAYREAVSLFIHYKMVRGLRKSENGEVSKRKDRLIYICT